MPGNVATITPADVAAWPKPNYVDPYQLTYQPVLAWTLWALSTLMVAARLWLRLNKKAGGLGLDDAVLAVAWIGSTFLTSVQSLAVTKYGVGRHIWDVPVDDYVPIALTAWLAEFAFLVATGACKISVLLFYRRLADRTYNKVWKWLVIGAIIFTSAWSLAFMLLLVFNCNPTDAYWKSYSTSYTEHYTCLETGSVNILAGVFSISSDIYSIALPAFVTRNCQLARSQRIALNILFSLGGLVVAASAVRTYYLYEVGVVPDVSWLAYFVYVWAAVETELGIMLATAPALRVLFRDYLSTHLTRFRSAASRTGSSVLSSKRRTMHRLEETTDSESGIQRHILIAQHRDKLSTDTGMSEDRGPASITTISAAPSTRTLFTEYEAYNLRNM